ncbi:MAG TPA: type IX secretion system sortase PorU [Acidobacteriota bacterium]|nr:type IX secretion system sortase PorU [Acidobacteriota bacterium]
MQVLASSDSEFHFRLTADSTLANLPYEADKDGRQLVFRSILLGLPPGAEATLIAAYGREAVSVARQRRSTLADNAGTAPLVEISPPFAVRGRRLVNVRVNPLIGNEVYQAVEVRVGFTGGAGAGREAESPDPLFDRIFRTSLANYDQARFWSHKTRPVATSAQAVENDLLKTDAWYKVIVTGTGLHKITGSQMAAAGVLLAGIDPDSIRLFNAGGLRLHEDNDSARPSFQEMAVIVDDGGDADFDLSDYVLFFGESVNRWVYRPDQAPVYMNHPYATENVYWLAFSGDFLAAPLRMQETSVAPVGSTDTTITSFLRPARAEQDNMISKDPDGHIKDYFTWYWTDTTGLTFWVPAPGAIDGELASVTLVGKTNVGTGDAAYMDLSVNGQAAGGKVCNNIRCQFETSQIHDGANRFDVTLGPQSLKVPPYFDYAELQYHSRLRPDGDRLDVAVGSYAGRAGLEIDDEFSSVPLILDVSDPLRPRILSGYEQSGGQITFEVDLDAAGPNRFFCAPVQLAAQPAAVAPASVADMRDTTQQADLIIITIPGLAPYLDEYIAYRRAQGYTIRVSFVDDIMDNYAYGLYDPTAVRDYLKFAYEHYPPPAPWAVLLVGDGSYDFLDHMGTGMHNLVPPYIRRTDQACSDDAYVHFGSPGILDSDSSYIIVPDRGLDMVTSRWPVRNGGAIRSIVRKIQAYEAKTGFGLWRNNITLVADDEKGATDAEVIHVQSSEFLDQNNIPAHIWRDKIYLWDYPLVNRQRPSVNDAIVDAFNRGTLIVNYVGHGNPDVWAHEHIFERIADLPRLTNADRLPLVYAASCAIGFFDDPQRESMGEALLSLDDGGGIAVIAATRLATAASNALLNQKVYDVLLTDTTLSISEALYVAKLDRQYPGPYQKPNDQKYVYLGDPCVRLALPKLDIEFTEVPDSLTALSRTRVRGRVVDGVGQAVPDDGTLLVNVIDSDRRRLFRLDESDTAGISYTVRGPSLFRGSATITGGTFDFEFITPLDVGYGGTGASITTYAILDTIDGLGQKDNIVIRDSVAVSQDSTGPGIAYSIAGRRNFVSGDVVSRDDVLQIRLTDPSGVNLADNLGHGITLEIDGRAENQRNLTDLFEYDRDSITTGMLEYPLASLDAGGHQFEIKAWDNANNVSVARFSAELASGFQLAINDLLNYPNPMNERTTFYFELTQPAERFSMEIFTLSGRRIWSVTHYGLAADNYPNGGISLVWNGRDVDGDRVATGVYIYKASARPQSGGEGVESFGKVVVVN